MSDFVNLIGQREVKICDDFYINLLFKGDVLTIPLRHVKWNFSIISTNTCLSKM